MGNISRSLWYLFNTTKEKKKKKKKKKKKLNDMNNRISLIKYYHSQPGNSGYVTAAYNIFLKGNSCVFSLVLKSLTLTFFVDAV